MGADTTAHPNVSQRKEITRELAGLMESLYIMFENCWRTEVFLDFKNGRKENLTKYSPFSLTLLIGKILKQMTKKLISKHLENNVSRGLLSDLARLVLIKFLTE